MKSGKVVMCVFGALTLAMILVTAAVISSNARVNYSSTFKEHTANNTCLDYIEQAVTSATATVDIQTSCAIVDGCAASLKSAQMSATDTVAMPSCVPKTQTGSDVGYITAGLLTPATSSGTAVPATATVSIVVVGRGSRY